MDIAILVQNPIVLVFIVSTLILMLIFYMMFSSKAHFTNCDSEDVPFKNIQDIIKLQEVKKQLN
jgi:hypothetical protein